MSKKTRHNDHFNQLRYFIDEENEMIRFEAFWWYYYELFGRYFIKSAIVQKIQENNKQALLKLQKNVISSFFIKHWLRSTYFPKK
jgi:hypothetical protein